MRSIYRLLCWSVVVGLLTSGAYVAGRLQAPGGTTAAAAPAPATQGSVAAQGQAHIWFMMTPGTIPRNPSDRLNYLRYVLDPSPRLTGEEMVERVPEINQWARVSVDAGNFWDNDSPAALRAISLRVNEVLARADVDGLILGHGTNNIEETAYWLNLTVKSDKPVVVVGSQRPFTTLSSDGPLNLLNAVRVAVHPDSRGKGVLVVTNDEINSARDVTKANTYRLETFQSRELGFLGYADPDEILYYRMPTRRHTLGSEFDVAAVAEFPRVSVLYAHSGVDDALVHAAVQAGARGIVVAGSGAGHTQAMRAALGAYAQQGIVVVRSARVGAGRVVRDDNWQEPGFVAADNLNPQKAWVLLTLALGQTSDPDRIQRMFETY